MKEWTVIWLVGFATGLHVRRILKVIAHSYGLWKHGVCFRYKPSGVRENRNGTVSDFCLRCGNPGGYHFDDE